MDYTKDFAEDEFAELVKHMSQLANQYKIFALMDALRLLTNYDIIIMIIKAHSIIPHSIIPHSIIPHLYSLGCIARIPHFNCI